MVCLSNEGSVAKRKSLRKLSLMGCEESDGHNFYNRDDGIEKLFTSCDEKSNLEYLSLDGAAICVQKHLDALIDFIADHRTLKEVNLSILLKDKRLSADAEWAYLGPKPGIRGCYLCYYFLRIPYQSIYCV